MSTPSFAFPQSLADKYRPRRIEDFAGLEKPKKILRKFAANPYPSAWLFVGPPGVGKTTMALALAETLSAELHHIPSQQCQVSAVEDVSDNADTLRGERDGRAKRKTGNMQRSCNKINGRDSVTPLNNCVEDRYWSRGRELNSRPADYESAALPLSYLGVCNDNSIR